MAILKKIKWFLKNITEKNLGFILHILIPRNNKYITFNASIDKGKREMFLHNTKYLYLYLSNREDFHVTWLCEDKNITKTLNNYGYKNVYSRKSLKGFFYALRSKYWFYDYYTNDLPLYLICGATLVNLWHGIPLKNICYDDSNNPIHNMNKIVKFIYFYCRYKDSYYIANGDYERNIYKTAFFANKEQSIVLGSPRLDVLFHNISNAEMFMERDFEAIKSFKKQGKKIFIYMPTYRDTGSDIADWLRAARLNDFFKDRNAILVCKLHPLDKNSLNFELTEEFYKMDSNSDIYPVLKYSDALISDYSSIAFDYLLLDKPIIYHVPDLQEYQDTCRGFYMPYEEFAVGEITCNEEEILSAMKNVIDGVDNYKEQRKVLRDRMFKYQDGKNCERVVEWIKSLDK